MRAASICRYGCLFAAQLCGGRRPLCLFGAPAALESGVYVVQPDAAICRRERLCMGRSSHPCSNLDSPACVVRAVFCPSGVLLEKVPFHVYAVRIFLSGAELFAFMAAQRWALSFLRGSVFPVCCGCHRKTPVTGKGADSCHGSAHGYLSFCLAEWRIHLLIRRKAPGSVKRPGAF